MKTLTAIKPVKTLEIPLFTFDQLSKEAKEKAKRKYYESETYDFLSDDITEYAAMLLGDAKIDFRDLRLMFSLSYSQGDGLCFTGEFTKYGIRMSIGHNYRYYFAKSVTFEFFNDKGEEIEEDGTNLETAKVSKANAVKIAKLKAIYFELAKKLEKHGYDILEYRANDEEFTDLCEANQYTFEGDGTMNNG